MTDKPGWTPHSDALARKADERSDKDTGTALEVLKLAIEATKGQNLNDQQLAAYAETLWKWTTTDTWPPKT